MPPDLLPTDVNVDRTTALFFDASCLIAAAGSPTGGSGFLLSLCARRLLRAVTSHMVLLEAERNIQAKQGPRALGRYHALLLDVPFTIVAVPAVSPNTGWVQQVNAKDAYVVAAMLAGRTRYLVTLDLRLIDEVNRAELPALALTPGTFIKQWLPLHTDFPSLRE